jgi:hypothetical protein
MKPFADFDTIANAKSDESRARESSRDSIFQVVSGHRAKPLTQPTSMVGGNRWSLFWHGMGNLGNIPASAERGRR